jgi:hypothetical protein
MEKRNNVILKVQHVMGWQDEHVAALTGWINAYANLLGTDQEEKAIDCIRTAMALEGEYPPLDINRWFYTVLSLIFYELAGILCKNERTANSKLLQKMQKQYAPETDFAASCFGNCFDEIDFEQQREAIIEEAIQILSGQLR